MSFFGPVASGMDELGLVQMICHEAGATLYGIVCVLFVHTLDEPF